jgi:hypothetical protein
MGLPDLVVDKPVLDGSQNGAWSRWHVCVGVGSDIPGAVEECGLLTLTDSVLLNIFSVGHLAGTIRAGGVRPAVENTEVAGHGARRAAIGLLSPHPPRGL